MTGNYNEYIKTVQTALWNTSFNSNVPYAMVRSIFLKYVADNYIGADSKEDMQIYMQLQKLFASRFVEGGPNILIPTFRLIDETYNLGNIISHSINNYAEDLFGLNKTSWQKKNVQTSHYKDVLEALSSMDLQDENYVIGKELVSLLIPMLEDVNKNNNYRYAEFMTGSYVVDVAKDILKVKNNDKFLDFASGLGISTLKIVEDTDTEVCLYDINPYVTHIAAMLLIMAGYKNFKIHNEDFGQSYELKDPENQYDKIFVDSPIVKMGYADEITNSKDSDIIVFNRCLNKLSSNGVAVVTMPGRVMFSQAKSYVETRRALIKNGNIRAVITLVPNYSVSSMPIHLFVLTKKYNEKVLLIDCTKDIDRKTKTLSDNAVGKVLATYEKFVEEAGYSKIVATAELDEKTSFVPAQRIESVAETTNMSIEEIDAELKMLYAKLMK